MFDGILLKHEEQHARADDEEQREVEDWRLGRHHDEAVAHELAAPGNTCHRRTIRCDMIDDDWFAVIGTGARISNDQQLPVLSKSQTKAL